MIAASPEQNTTYAMKDYQRDFIEFAINAGVLRFGDFEITVSIEHGESIVMPLDEPESKVSENVASLVPDDSLRTGVELLDEDALTGDDDFQSALFGSPTDTGVAERAEEVVEELYEPPKHFVPKELAESDLVATDLIDSFLDGLGINRAELHPSTDLAETPLFIVFKLILLL